ncbi:MAG: hypothetical protein FWB80_02925 [Defluviitaleaceae bacterium]|nr:hypothetical protein [Defluviitaleaceae bacterium]
MYKIWLGFAVFNAALLIFVWIAFGAAAVDSLEQARALVRLQEGRYAAEVRLLGELEENLQELEEINILRRDEIFFVLSEINGLGQDFGLVAVDFSAAEAAVFYEILEMRVRMELDGGFYDILGFLDELAGRDKANSLYMSSFSISDIMDMARLRVYFSLFSMK